MSRWQSRVFVCMGATLGLALVAGLVIAASVALDGGAHASAPERPAVVGRG